MKKIFKNDQYRRARGGTSKKLLISCASCKSLLCHYQKDGPGSLKRMYLDRIGEPLFPDSKTNGLHCPKCGQLLGVAMIYKKENRRAYRLLPGTVTKKTVK